MANRVVLGAFNGAYVLRVSRPGFNVLDPNLVGKQLAFDSRWASVNNLWMSGIAAGRQTVMFGRTFPYLPTVLFARPEGGGWRADGFYTGGQGFERTDIYRDRMFIANLWANCRYWVFTR